jgi:hypothetical protein
LKSKVFIDDFSRKWASPVYRAHKKQQAYNALGDFFDLSDEEQLKRIVHKLEKIENAPSGVSKGRVVREKEEEVIDLIGWEATGDWCEKAHG